MKKNYLYIIIAVLAIIIIGCVAYIIMADMGYFGKATVATVQTPGAELGGVALIPILKYLWNKLVQLFYLVVTVLIGGVILSGIGVILF